MKKYCLLILFLFGVFLFANDLLFEANFDQFTLDANIGKGGTKCLSFSNPDLQMRMFPGINNKGNSVNLENREFCSYNALGNINPQQGTVTVWVAPVNWKPSEKKIQVFFDTFINNGKMRLMLLKNQYANCFYAVITHKDAPGSQKNFQATSFIPDVKWPKLKWHRLDMTWDGEQLKLYVDGLQTPKHRWHVSTVKFPQRFTFPKATPKDKINIGSGHWKNKLVETTHRTAFDLVQIYNRPLSASEIKNSYEKTIPSLFGKNVKRNLFTIPYSKDKSNVLSLPMNIVFSGGEYRKRLANANVKVRYDENNIYVNFFANYTPRKAEILKHDGNVWEDDCIELHLKSSKGNRYQFIVNSNGIVYDAKNGNSTWNSFVKTVSSVKNGKWNIDLIIPRKSFDAFAARDIWYGNIYLSLLTNNKSYCFQTVFDGQDGKMFVNPGNYAFFKWGNDNGISIDMANNLQSGNFQLKLKNLSKRKYLTEAFLLAENGEKIVFHGDIFNSIWKTPLNAGKYQLFLKVALPNNDLLIYDRIFTVNKPLELKYTSFPSKKQLEVVVDFGNSGGNIIKQLLSKGIIGKLALTFNGKEYSSTTIKATKIKTVATLALPENLPSGTFFINAKFDSLNSSISFRVPDMTPYKLKIASDHKVPAPWKNIVQKDKLQFEVWDRVYTFGNSPAPIQVTSRGSNMLVDKVTWKLNNKSILWSEPRLVEKFDDYIKLAGTGVLDNIKFSWVGILHFDGVYHLDLKMTPKEKEAKISSLLLTYSVPKEHSRYILTPTLLPWRNNKISTRYEILQPNNNRDFFIWNSGIEKGFMWWPKSTANFANKLKEKQISLFRESNKTVVEISIISKPVLLTKTANYTNVFLATPMKRLPQNFRIENMSGWRRAKYQTYQPMGWGVFGANETPEDCTSAAGLLLAHPEKFQSVLDNWKKYNIKPLLYGMPAQIATNDAEYDYFYAEWAKTPTYIHSITKKGSRIVNEPMCGHTKVADLGAYRADKLLKSFPDLAGLYFDLSDVRFCENQHHNCGGIDAFGKPYLSSIALNMHSYMKRIYKVSRKYDKKILMHAHNLFNPIAHSFNDFWYPGEHTFRSLALNPEYGYTESISLEEYQAEYSSLIRGMPVIFLPQYARIAHKSIGFVHLRPRLGEFYGPEYALRTMTPLLVHDINVAAEQIHWGTCGKLWTIRHDLDLGNAVFYGYWFDNTVKCSTPKVLASWYKLNGKTKYKRLIVISNFNRTAKIANLSVNTKKFGVGDNLVFTDLWQNKKLTLEEINKFTIKGNHFMLLGVE